MNIQQPTAKHFFQERTAFLLLLQNPVRLRILTALREGEKTVGDLVAALGVSQSAMSQHLQRLREGGLVQSRRDQQTIYCSCNSDAAYAIIDLLQDLYGKH